MQTIYTYRLHNPKIDRIRSCFVIFVNTYSIFYHVEEGRRKRREKEEDDEGAGEEEGRRRR